MMKSDISYGINRHPHHRGGARNVLGRVYPVQENLSGSDFLRLSVMG